MHDLTRRVYAAICATRPHDATERLTHPLECLFEDRLNGPRWIIRAILSLEPLETRTVIRDDGAVPDHRRHAILNDWLNHGRPQLGATRQ